MMAAAGMVGPSINLGPALHTVEEIAATGDQWDIGTPSGGGATAADALMTGEPS